MQGRAGPLSSKSNSGEGEERRENAEAVVEVETIDSVQMKKMMKGLGR